MKDDKKQRLRKHMQELHRWLVEDIIYQQADYRNKKLTEREQRERIEYLDIAISGSLEITELLIDEKKRIVGDDYEVSEE